MNSALLTEAVLPNLKGIVAIWNVGKLPVLFFDLPQNADNFYPHDFGWRGDRVDVRPATRCAITRFANALPWLRPLDGKSAVKWVRRKGVHRLLVFHANETLFLSFDEEHGFSEARWTE